jgi:hypothetical protein
MKTSLGQIAYDAFWLHESWMDDQGLQVVSWESASLGQQAAWEAAAKAVAVAVTQARQQVEIQALEHQE